MTALGPGAAGFGGVPGSAQTHPLAIASLACGISALPFGCCCSLVSVPIAIAGISCGIVGLSKIKTQPETHTGLALCVIGIVLGASSLAYVALSLGLGLSASFLRKLLHP